MTIEDYWFETRKIRTVSIDTDVISDILTLKLFERRLTELSDSFKKRLENSFQLFSVLFSVKIELIGIKMIKKELSEKESFKRLYNRIFDKTLPHKVEIKRLANNYLKKRKMKRADAFILASVSVGNIDCFFSWNRRDIVNETTLKTIYKINKKRNISFPLIITPEDFLKRIIISNQFTLCFSHEAILRGYRPRFYPSKRFL